MIFTFGTCRVDTSRMLLERDGAPVHIEPQVFALLRFLIENRGRAVTKAEIFEEIWNNRAISDAVLTTRIRSLRQAIDDIGGTSMIRTVHRVGYEFLPDVVTTEAEHREASAPQPTFAPRPASEPVDELRQVVVVAFQPRLKLDTPFDPERLDRLIATVRRKLTEHLDARADDIQETAEGTLYAMIGAYLTREDDIERAAGLALEFADTAAEGDAKLAVALAKGRVAKSDQGYRGSGVLRAAQTVGQATSGEVLVSPELVAQLPDHADISKQSEGIAKLVGLAVQQPQTLVAHPFVGRLVEEGLVEGAIDAMIEHRSGGCITLEGAAGVGKSRLAARAVDLVLGRGGLASSIFMRELGADGALHRNLFSGFRDAVEACGQGSGLPNGDLARILDGSVGRSPVYHGPDLAEAMIALLRRVSEVAPLLIVVEDAHWMDAESCALAEELAAICSEIRAVLLVTARPSSAGFLQDIAEAAQGDIVALSLSPLSLRQSHELIGLLAPEITGEEVNLLAERAAGNPLFLTKLIEAYQIKGPASLSYVPGTIQSAVQAQFDQLSEADRETLKRLSVLGERFEVSVATAALPDFEASDALPLSFLRKTGAWLQFSHNLVRETIYATITQKTRRRLHTAVAHALVPHDPLLAAEHAMLGDLTEAPAICVKVARDTFHFRRHGRSVRLIEKAIGLDCTPDQRAQLEVFLGSAAMDLSDEAEAMRHYRIAAERAETSVPAVFAHVRIARIHARHDRLADAHAALDDAAGWLKPGTGPGYLASEIAETRAALLWLQRNPDAAIEEAERALHLSDHPHATGRALLTLGWACFSAGRFQDARHSVEECLDLVAKKNLKLVEPEVKALAVRFHWYADPSASQMEHATEFVGRAHRIGLRQTRVETRVARLEIAWELENWDVFDEDVQAVQSEIKDSDRLSLATLRFFQALRGGAAREPDSPSPASPDVFLPLAAVSGRGACTAQDMRAATPLERLWLHRLGSEHAEAVRLELSEAATVQSEPWRAWCHSRRFEA